MTNKMESNMKIHLRRPGSSIHYRVPTTDTDTSNVYLMKAKLCLCNYKIERIKEDNAYYVDQRSISSPQ